MEYPFFSTSVAIINLVCLFLLFRLAPNLKHYEKEIEFEEEHVVGAMVIAKQSLIGLYVLGFGPLFLFHILNKFYELSPFVEYFSLCLFLSGCSFWTMVALARFKRYSIGNFEYLHLIIVLNQRYAGGLSSFMICSYATSSIMLVIGVLSNDLFREMAKKFNSYLLIALITVVLVFFYKVFRGEQIECREV